MSAGVVAALILVSVSLFVGFATWRMNRRFGPELDKAAQEVVQARADPASAPPHGRPQFSRKQVRLYAASFAFTPTALFLGVFLLGKSGALHGLGIALVLIGVVITLVRPRAYIRAVRRAPRVFPDGPGAGNAG